MCDGGAKTQSIEWVLTRAKANFNVRQAISISQLREAHGQKLIPAREPTNPIVAVVALDTTPELFRMDPSHELRENRLFGVHSSSVAPALLGKTPKGVQIDHIVFAVQPLLFQPLSTNEAPLNRMTVSH